MIENSELIRKNISHQNFWLPDLHDTERVSGLLEACGSREVSDTDDADIVIFMTCSVRENADQHLYSQASAMVPVLNASIRQARCYWRLYCAAR